MTWSLLVRCSAFYLVRELSQLLEVLINEVLCLLNMGGDSFDWLSGFAIKFSNPPACFYRPLLSECQGDFPWCAQLPPAPYLARLGILDSYLLYFSCFGFVHEVPVYLKHCHRTVVLDFNRFAWKSAKLAVWVNSNSMIPLFLLVNLSHFTK